MVSRALLTTSTIALCAVQVIFYFKDYSLRSLKLSWRYLSIAMILLLSIFSGLQGGNSDEWMARTVVKIPLLLLILIMLTIEFNDLEVFTVHQLWVTIILLGTWYSVGNYILYHKEMLEMYKLAQVIPTPMSNDHIRFSWCVYIAIIFCGLIHQEITSKKLRIVNGVITAWFVVYLHILGSKTGLVMLYMGALIFIIVGLRKIDILKRLILLLGFIALPFAAYFTLPSFKERIHYIKYDFEQYSNGKFRSGLSDGVRVLSMHAALDIVKQKPIFGIGIGNVKEATNKWYDNKAPQLMSYERFLPISQIMMVLASFGFVGVVLFVVSLFVPFRIAGSYLPFLLFYIPAIFSLIFEPHLEGQISVFVFGFFTMWFLFLSKNIVSHEQPSN